MPPKPWLYRQRLESLLQHRSVQDWLGRTPKKTDFYIFQAYLKWRKEKGLDEDPDKWVEECLNGNNLTLVKHLRTLLEWAQGPSLDGLADISRIRYYCVVRAFYRKNFVSLPEANIKVRREASEVSQQVTANQFDAMLRKVLEVGRLSVRDRAIMLTMRQGGMDDSTLALSFNFVGFPQLARHFGTPDPSKWEETKVPVKVDLVRPKTDYRYFTGLHRDAVVALKDYLAVRGIPRPRPSRNLKSLPTSEPLFLKQTGGPISPEAVGVIYNESGKRAGINVRPEGKFDHHTGAKIRYPFHGHECRDSLVTLSRKAGVPEAVANFFIGHSIDRYGYDKSPWNDPDHFMEEYARMSRWLNVVTGELEEKEAEIEKARRETEPKVTKLEHDYVELEGRYREMQEAQKAILEALRNRKVVELLRKGAKIDPALLSLKKDEMPTGTQS